MACRMPFWMFLALSALTSATDVCMRLSTTLVIFVWLKHATGLLVRDLFRLEQNAVLSLLVLSVYVGQQKGRVHAAFPLDVPAPPWLRSTLSKVQQAQVLGFQVHCSTKCRGAPRDEDLELNRIVLGWQRCLQSGGTHEWVGEVL